MRNSAKLCSDCSINPGLIVPVQVGPDRRVRVQILAPPHILEHRSPALHNHDRFTLQPIAHLRERMPDVLMIELRKGMHHASAWFALSPPISSATSAEL